MALLGDPEYFFHGGPRLGTYSRGASARRMRRSQARFLRVLRRSIKQFTEEEQQHALRYLTQEAVNEITARNPILTGLSSRNWHVTRNTQGLSKRPPPATPAQGPEEARNLAAPVIAEIRAFDTVYVQNNLDYISELERGTSSQAPQGMVAVTLNRLRTMRLPTLHKRIP